MKSATVLPPAPEIILERPKKMSMEDFRAARTAMNKAIKSRLRGFLVFKSQELILDQQGRPVAKAFKRGHTHVGTTRYLQLV